VSGLEEFGNVPLRRLHKVASAVERILWVLTE
jgi:hypothetical protein